MNMRISFFIKTVRAKRGMTLLLIVILLAAFLSIAMGVINILLGQIFLVGQSGESFQALYAADAGMERTLYRDRVLNVFTAGIYIETNTFADGSCYQMTLNVAPSGTCVAPSTTCIVVRAQSSCFNVRRFVEREFDVKY